MGMRMRAKRRNEKNSNRISRTLNQQTNLSRKSTNSQLLHLQRKYGNSILQRMYESGALQAKLKIGKPGDKYEREADSVADRVMNMPEPDISRQEDKEEKIRSKPLAEQITPLVQRQTEEEEEIKKQPEEEEEEAQAKFLQRQEEDEEEVQKQPEEEEEEAQAKFLQRQEEDEEEVQKQPEEEEEEPVQAKLLQRQPEDEEVQKQSEEEEVQTQPEEEEEPVQAKSVGSKAGTISSNVESGINSIRGGGKPLPESSRAFFEPRFGADFSGVRVHSDSNANQLARSINAKAFTLGRDVVFGSGQYSPKSSSGKQLLAHELTHVVQQGGYSKNKATQHSMNNNISKKVARVSKGIQRHLKTYLTRHGRWIAAEVPNGTYVLGAPRIKAYAYWGRYNKSDVYDLWATASQKKPLHRYGLDVSSAHHHVSKGSSTGGFKPVNIVPGWAMQHKADLGTFKVQSIRQTSWGLNNVYMDAKVHFPTIPLIKSIGKPSTTAGPDMDRRKASPVVLTSGASVKAGEEKAITTSDGYSLTKSVSTTLGVSKSVTSGVSGGIAKLIEANLGTSTTVSESISKTLSKQITQVKSFAHKTMKSSGIIAVVPGTYWFVPTVKVTTHPVTINQPDADGKLIGSKTVYIHAVKYTGYASVLYERNRNLCLLDQSGKVVKNYGPLK